MKKLVALTALPFALALTAPAPAKITLFMIGDSTMADRPNPEKNPYRGWGQLLQRFYDDSVEVRNFAVNGLSSKSFIDEGRWDAVLAQLGPGDYVVIQFGHDDERKEDPRRYTAPEGAYRENLERFVKDARAKGAHPILCTAIVRRKFDAAGKLEDTHGEYPRVAREVARQLDVPLVDLQRMTAQLVSRAGPDSSKRFYAWVPPGTNEMYPQGLTDDTDLSVRGASAVALLAARGIAATNPPLAHHTRPEALDALREP